jgi:leucyl aminopeptidase
MTQIPLLTMAAAEGPAAELVAVGCFQGGDPAVAHLPAAVRQAVLEVAGRPGWKGRDEQTGQAGNAPVVALYGLGGAAELSFAKLSRWLERVAEDARLAGVRRLAVALPPHAETSGQGAAMRLLRAAALAGYRFDRYRSEPENGGLEEVQLLPPDGTAADYEAVLGQAVKVAAAVAYTRDLANTPGNVAGPAWLEAQARALAASHGLDIQVLDAAELERRQMGGLLAVGRGSRQPPRLVRLAYDGPRMAGQPEAAPGAAAVAPPPGAPPGTGRPQVALVGKGVTFDSGGISIKPAADMEEMKFDKCGACAVLGALRAAAELGLDVRLRAYLVVAENMLSGDAYRPGDILRCYNGKTVEITNTDAEGRVMLADALSMAVEEGAEALVELSTLTGSCVVALGHMAAGLFSPDDAFAAELERAAAAGGERLWRLPLLAESLEELRSLHADLRNQAGRWGGASLAAAFLAQFVGGLRRWAHLDIAGVAHERSEERAGTFATGFGVATLIEWLRRQAG